MTFKTYKVIRERINREINLVKNNGWRYHFAIESIGVIRNMRLYMYSWARKAYHGI
jgi:hypothetical protein